MGQVLLGSATTTEAVRRAIQYPLRSRGFRCPEAIIAQERIRKDNDLSHDRSDSDLRVFSLGYEPVIDTLEIRIEPHGNDSWHVESLPETGAASLDGASTAPCAGLPRDWCQAGKGGSLTFVHGAKFRHIGE